MTFSKNIFSWKVLIPLGFLFWVGFDFWKNALSAFGPCQRADCNFFNTNEFLIFLNFLSIAGLLLFFLGVFDLFRKFLFKKQQ